MAEGKRQNAKGGTPKAKAKKKNDKTKKENRSKT